MKTLLGIVIGAGLMLGGSVLADTQGIEFVGKVDPDWEDIRKYYDHDNGVVCYTNKNDYSGGISCLRN